MKRSAAVILATCAIFFVPAGISQTKSGEHKVDFDREIRPIFSENCFSCHGPDEKQRKAKLRLDSKEGLFEMRGKAPVVITGDAAKSRLFARVSDAGALRMPPEYSGKKPLDPKQIAAIRQWIDEGANYKEHWSFAAPKRPELPPVSNAGWARNDIDRFILARLDKEKLKPSPEADHATLLRRVSFDLTGLPPTPAEVAAFETDRSADAYEKQVDRLLKSPHYGERMAMQWLDLARYADTHGYHIDSGRSMWRWRDWVINAFNNNKPYDQFTIEQLAGDLLPNATQDQKIATGFNRNHMINFEGGAIPEEYQNEYVIDRLETTSITWLGLTMGCARCHDHKFDPISQKDFYRFYAFFNSISEKGLDGQRGNAEPFLSLPSGEQKQRQDELTASIKAHEKTLADERVGPMELAWEAKRLAAIPEVSRQGLVAHYTLDGSLSDVSGNYRHARTLQGDLTFGASEVGRAAEFDGDTQVSFGDAGKFDSGPEFSLAAWMHIGGNKPMTLIEKISDAGTRQGMELFFDDFQLIDIQVFAPQLHVRFSNKWPDDALELRTKDYLDPRVWHHVALTHDVAGAHLFLDGKAADVEVVKSGLRGSWANAAPLEEGDKTIGKPFRGKLADFRIYSRVLSAREIAQLEHEEPLRGLLLALPDKRNKEQKAALRNFYLTYDAPEDDRRAYAELVKLRSSEKELVAAIPTTMVMAEMEKARETAILGRGDYRNRGEIVTPGVPGVLPPLPAGEASNRMALAKWLVNPNHPLTSRVAVNRYWQMYFGFGIVKTTQDFGAQGEEPVNPELLDWLATEFVRSGWDIRAMQRLMVTSAAYRQSSRVTPELLEKDPENRLLARGPRFRLPAEMVRDNALLVSGLYKDHVGGPSVKPYQPKGLWEELSFGDGFSEQNYVQGKGDDLYRRTMYTFWKRTSPPPAPITFDSPDREKCSARRLLTNTPLQALVSLNDPTYVEAARALAQRMLIEAPKTMEKRIAYGFELATLRKPSAQEEKVLQGLATRELAEYKHHPEAAFKLLAVGDSKADPKLNPGDLAAWTTVASTILNLDETLTKE